MRRFYIFFLVLLALSSSINTVNAAVVIVSDDVLAAKLRETFGLADEADITDTDLESLTTLVTAVVTETDPQIQSLEGLEFAINLTVVSLIGHNISDLDPLTTWTSIETLNLTGNSIVDLRPLENLTTLTHLYLAQNQIMDVSHLAELTQLADLTLSGNDNLEDTSPLAWLPLLTLVDVDIPLAVRIIGPEDKQSGAFAVTIEFSEAVTGFEQADIDLTGSATATVTSLTGSDEEYTATITPESDGEVVIQVPANVAVDDNRENNIASPEYPVSVDVPPQVTEIGWPSSFVELGDRREYQMLLTDDPDVSVNITFSEDVIDFELDDIELLGTATTAAIESLTGSDSEYTLTISITPTTDGTGDGTLGIDIRAGVVQDVSGDNDNIEYSTGDSDTAVLFIPTLEIVVPEEPQNGAFDVQFVFNELVTGFTQGWLENFFDSDSTMVDIGGTLTGWDENATGTVYTATITPTRDGVLGIRFAGGGIPAVNTDGVKIPHQVLSPGSVIIDLTPPTVEITGVPTQTQTGPFEVTITFGEDVTGFEADDISLTGSATAELTGSGSDYTATITPEPGADGNVIIQVPANIAEDAAENGNTESQSHTVSVDLARPTVEITGVPTQTQTDAFEVTITFGEDVTGFEADDISLTGSATAEASVLMDSGSDYTATITPEPGADGNVIIQVPANIAEDAAENGNTESQSHTVSVDLARPTVEITGVPTQTQTDAFEVTITFGEDVTGFEADDISLTGSATAEASVLMDSGSDYTATITPEPGADGNVIIQVPANIAEDAAENGNTESQSHTVSVDLARPTVEITGVPTQTQTGPFEVTITFGEDEDEDVTGFEADDISLTGMATATVTDWSVSGAAYTAEITPTADGDLVIQVLAGVAFDAAGNGNTESQSHTVTVDVSRPTVEITGVPTQTQTDAFDVTIEFSEDVTGFEADGISLSATASAMILIRTGAVYTVKITPAEDAEGEVTFHVRENAAVAVNGVDKGNTASLSHTVSVDLVAPTVEITGVPTQVTMDTFEVTITFSEEVTGFIADDILLSASASATVRGTTGAVYPVTITLVGEIAESIIIQVPKNIAQDAAGNFNTESREHRIEAWMPDKNLRDIVRDVLGLPVDEIFTKEELLELRVLDAAEVGLFTDDSKITDLTGLEYATELTELYLNEHAISDLSPLATLTQLTKLSLNDNEIENLWHEDSDDNPFADLTELTELSLDDNLIDDLSPLESLAQLTTLSLNDNLIEDLSLLEALTELTELSLDLNLIEDITTLEVLTQLTALSLNENPIDDLMPLEGLTELTELSLNDNSIEDIFFCAALTQLKILCLEDNEISDVSPLAGLPNLEMLKLSGNPIDDTAPLIGIARRIEADEPIASLISDEELAEVLSDIFDLDREEHVTYADMRSLTTFEAPDSDITDLSGLEHATELDTLDLRGNTIENLTPLKELTKLTSLDLGVNSISNIDALAGLTELTDLDLEANGITDITPLLGLANLEVLRLADNPIADARPLAALTDVDIDIDVTMYLVAVPDAGLTAALQDALGLEASDGIPSTQLQALTTLDAQDRQISNLTGLELATALTELDLRDNAISDVTPLAGLVNLEILRLTGNPIQDASALTDLTAHIEADIVVPGVITDAVLAVAIRETLGLPVNTRIIAETLQDLVNLNVREGEINTLAGLEHAANLTTLEINAGAITDITPLQTLAELTTLEINSDVLTAITPLQALTQLTTLKINGGSITDVTPLQTLAELTILELRDNTITDITPLSELTTLTTLNLSGNNISSIEALEGLTALTTLNLSSNSISSIDRLQELTRLTTLNLSSNSISSIDRLQELTRLTTLNLSGNSLSSIEALQVLTRLTTLNLSDNSISSIEALQGLTALTTLEFADNSLSSIDGLQALTALTTLNLSTNDLRDIQPLQGLTELKQLSLMSNNINDVLSLAGLVNLEFLRLAGNPIMDTSPLFPLVTTYKLMDVDIEISQWAPWDVNQDGIVNVMDATLVTAAIGQTGGTIANSLTDVNDDGVVDRNDLLLVQEHLNTDAAGAPATDTIVALLGLDTLKSLSRTSLEAEMNALIAETDGSLKYQRAIKFLENFLLALRPNKTRLLANYPNPFNPETWIPYTLATVSAVQITIYDARGAVVRRLDLGHQREGYYTSRSRAAYWDGRNHVGERVASGIYFYELAADDISRLRKMVILK